MSPTTNLPLVSIITPSYNQAVFLEDTLQSVFHQDYPEIEYLVVDGASTDGSLEIIRRYADKLTWWVSEPDSGQAEAINKGLQRARGEIVAWLNSDDLYLPGAVRHAVQMLQFDPELVMAYGDAITINQAGEPINSLRFGDWGLKELLGFRIICQPAVFMRRSALLSAGLLDPGYHYLLDHHLWLRLASLGPIQHAPHFWAAARHHSQAKNVAQASAFGQEALRIAGWLRQHPVLGPLSAKGWRHVQGGAQRLNARYLLDGGAYGAALKAYARAFRARPAFTLQHWHRILYAVISLLGGKKLAAWYYDLRADRRPNLTADPRLANWPGLHLD